MPYPSPVTYPSPSLYPGLGSKEGLLVALGESLVLGAADNEGVRWTLPTFEGWRGSPAPTLELTERLGTHGATDSQSFMTPRYIRAGGFVHCPTHESMDGAEDRLNGAVRLSEFQLTVIHHGRYRHAMVRRQGEVIFTPLSDRLAQYSILIVAKDPRKFGDLESYSTVLPFSSGGLEFPITFPVTWTGTSGTGTITINNPGNTEAPVWLRINGPLPAGGHSVTHQGKKRTLTFGTTLALAAGEFLTVDMDRREVLAQGQSPRSGYVTNRGWFSLDPGDNVISFSSVNYSATASLTLSTKPAWS